MISKSLKKNIKYKFSQYIHIYYIFADMYENVPDVTKCWEITILTSYIGPTSGNKVPHANKLFQ